MTLPQPHDCGQDEERCAVCMDTPPPGISERRREGVEWEQQRSALNRLARIVAQTYGLCPDLPADWCDRVLGAVFDEVRTCGDGPRDRRDAEA